MYIKKKGDNMVNWYYVVGSDRVGPVSVEALKVLFMNNSITLETYVWKKGFANWERLRDVSELKFDQPMEVETPVEVAPVEEVKAEPKVEAKKAEPVKAEVKPKAKETSPDVQFAFNWNQVKENEDLFFLKIGKDRKNNSNSDIYGPYSLVELKEALKEKRINLQTLLFAPGMSSWTKIQDTIINDKYKGTALGSIGLNEIPLLMVINYSPLPLVTIVKKAGTKEGTLLGAGPFSEFQNTKVMATLYVGSEMKVKDIQVKVQGYDKINQSIECEFIDLNSDAKKIMLNHAV